MLRKLYQTLESWVDSARFARDLKSFRGRPPMLTFTEAAMQYQLLPICHIVTIFWHMESDLQKGQLYYKLYEVNLVLFAYDFPHIPMIHSAKVTIVDKHTNTQLSTLNPRKKPWCRRFGIESRSSRDLLTLHIAIPSTTTHISWANDTFSDLSRYLYIHTTRKIRTQFQFFTFPNRPIAAKNNRTLS